MDEAKSMDLVESNSEHSILRSSFHEVHFQIDFLKKENHLIRTELSTQITFSSLCAWLVPDSNFQKNQSIF
jgi:hypothetical protein